MAVAVVDRGGMLDAWSRNQELSIHGWIYGINDGILKDLSVFVTKPEEVKPAYSTAINRYC